MKRILLFSTVLFLSLSAAAACSPQGDQTTYGTNNVWIGYVYSSNNFLTYKGYVNEGISTNPNFDESFGGAQVSYNTNGCPLNVTDTFSVRYKLQQTFSDGDYTIVAGGDDGYRLSIDGGSTWLINNWSAHSYASTTSTVHLTGSVKLVLEYFENTGDNRIMFNITKNCGSSVDQSIYGTNNKWIGYVYSGYGASSFATFKGTISEGAVASPNFDEGFGGDVATLNSSDCSIVTTGFSVRYRLNVNLSPASYTITVGGDDGYRLSLDGGTTWPIDAFTDHGYQTTAYKANLSGKYNMVLEYYENAGANRVTFNVAGGTVLPVSLTAFSGTLSNNLAVDLSWTTMDEKDMDSYEIQRSTDALTFSAIGTIASKDLQNVSATTNVYSYSDKNPAEGVAYYRIRAIGKDNYTYVSSIVTISNQVADAAKIYPTIVRNNQLYISSGKQLHNARLEFFDMNGKKISETGWNLLSGKQSVRMTNGSVLPSGSYVARLTAEGKPVLQQMMLVAAR